MNNMVYDVAVIGAGPAGATCATSLLAHGITSVALIDRSRFPRDKSCGDGIGPGAVNVMEELGIQHHLSSHPKIERLAVSSPSGIEISGPLPKIGETQPVGYVIPRIVFDNYIFRSALDRGAQDVTGYDLTDAVFDSAAGVWQLQLSDSKGELPSPHHLTARILVGADGARSRVRRILDVPANPDEHTGIGVRIYGQSAATTTPQLRLDFVKTLLPAYGWVFPIDGNRANLGVGIDLSAYKSLGRHLDVLLAEYLSRTNLSAPFEIDTTTSLSAILPYGSALPRISYPKVQAALIGDAASMINPFTGEGIFYGMFAGLQLGRRLSRGIRGGRVTIALHDFERDFRDRFEEHFQTNWTMKRATSVAKWCDLVIGASKKDERILAELIDLMMGDQKKMQSKTILKIIRRSFLPF